MPPEVAMVLDVVVFQPNREICLAAASADLQAGELMLRVRIVGVVPRNLRPELGQQFWSAFNPVITVVAEAWVADVKVVNTNDSVVNQLQLPLKRPIVVPMRVKVIQWALELPPILRNQFPRVDLLDVGVWEILRPPLGELDVTLYDVATNDGEVGVGASQILGGIARVAASFDDRIAAVPFDQEVELECCRHVESKRATPVAKFRRA